MQSVGRLWLANIARGAWSGERAAVGWGYLGWGKAPTPSAARSSEERYTQRARPANLIRPIAIEKVKGDE